MIHLTFDYKSDEECTTPGQYLWYYRTFKGISTKELANSVGIVPAPLTLYENDKRLIKYETAVALAEVLGIDRNKLLDRYNSFINYPYLTLLKKVRQDLSLSQIQIAEEIGISQPAYCSWERGSRIPRRKEYEKNFSVVEKHNVDVGAYFFHLALT